MIAWGAESPSAVADIMIFCRVVVVGTFSPPSAVAHSPSPLEMLLYLPPLVAFLSCLIVAAFICLAVGITKSFPLCCCRQARQLWWVAEAVGIVVGDGLCVDVEWLDGIGVRW